MVRAKMLCSSVTKMGQQTPTSGPQGHISMVEVKLTPVMGKDNEPWSKYTPSGGLQLGITNPECFDRFEAGKVYWVDVTPVE